MNCREKSDQDHEDIALYSICDICGREYSGLNCLRCTQQAITIQSFGAETIGPTAKVAAIQSKTPLSDNLARLRLGAEQLFFAVPKPVCRIGHDSGNDIIISDDPDVARFHAQITFEEAESEYRLRDLGTKAGVLLNNQRIQLDEAIFGGDIIKIGCYKFYFLSDQLF